MSLKPTWAIAQRCLAVCTLTILGALGSGSLASASLLPVEQDSWSDIVIGGSNVIYDGSTLTATRVSQATQIEIGGEFGPGNPGTHYGPGGTLGAIDPLFMPNPLTGNSPVFVSFDLSGVDINSSGVVTDGGSLTVTYTGPPAGMFPGDFADDYGIGIGATLLEGTVIEVLISGIGGSVLEVLFDITGGVLQTGTNSEPSLAGVPFATTGRGALLFASTAFPADWSNPFTVNSPTMDLFGIPEPSSMGLGMIGVILTMVRRSRRRED